MSLIYIYINLSLKFYVGSTNVGCLSTSRLESYEFNPVLNANTPQKLGRVGNRSVT